MCMSAQRTGLLLISLLFLIPILAASEHRNHRLNRNVTGLFKSPLHIPYRSWQNQLNKTQSNSKKSIEDNREKTDLSALAEQKKSNNSGLPARTIESSIVANEDLQVTHFKQGNDCTPCTPNPACGCYCATTCMVLETQCGQICTRFTVYTAEYLQEPVIGRRLSTGVTIYDDNCNDDCLTSDVTINVTNDVTSEESVYPTSEASVYPTSEASAYPTINVTNGVTSEASVYPTINVANDDVTSEASVYPTSEASVYPTSEASIYPTSEASIYPTINVANDVTSEASVYPTINVANDVTSEASVYPTINVANDVTSEASVYPTSEASAYPTINVTNGVTSEESVYPTSEAPVYVTDNVTIDVNNDVPLNLTIEAVVSETDNVTNDFTLSVTPSVTLSVTPSVTLSGTSSVTNYVTPVAIVVGGLVAIALAVAIPLGINPPPVESIPPEPINDFSVIEDNIPFNNQPFLEKEFPPDGCGNNSVRMEIEDFNSYLDRNRSSDGNRPSGGNCEPLMRRGNCRSPQDWVTVNPTTLKGRCTPRLCGRERVFVGRDGLCHDIYDPGECQGGRRLYYSPFGDLICDCPIGEYPFPNAEDNCVALFTKGPCREGSVVGISSQGQLECMPSQCQSTNVGDKSLQMLPAEDGRCYALGTQGPCSPPSLLGYDIFKRKMECVDVQNDTSPYFTSPEEEALVDSIYNQRSPSDFDDFRISMVFDSPIGTNDNGQRRQGATTGGLFQFPSFSPEALLNPCRAGARREMNYKCTNPLVPNSRTKRETLQAVRPAFQCTPDKNLQATGKCVTDNRSTNCGPSFKFNPSTGQCRSIF